MTKNPKNKDSDIPFDVPAIQNTEVVASDLNEYAATAGQGFETHTRDDYAIPFLGVLQSNSPLIETNATARAGMLVNTVTKELFDGKDGIVFVPSYTHHVVVEWKPRDQGAGFVAIHTLDSDLVIKVKKEQEFGKYKVTKGDEKSNDLIETFYVYGIFVAEDGSYQQMVIAFSSTKIRVYKNWMNRARYIMMKLPDGRQINPAIYSYKYRINSVSEKNAKGSFYNFSINFDGGAPDKALLSTRDPIFQDAKKLYEVLAGGATIKTAQETQTEAGPDPVEDPFK